MKPQELLRAAADNITKALASLDASEEPCGCCGLIKFKIAEHGKTVQQFEQTASKLRDAAARLDAYDRRITATAATQPMTRSDR